LFFQLETVADLSFSSSGNSFKLNSPARAVPHCSQVVVLIFVFPSSKKVAFLVLMSIPKHGSPSPRLHSYLIRRGIDKLKIFQDELRSDEVEKAGIRTG
jgi:hypothetical protein